MFFWGQPLGPPLGVLEPQKKNFVMKTHQNNQYLDSTFFIKINRFQDTAIPKFGPKTDFGRFDGQGPIFVKIYIYGITPASKDLSNETIFKSLGPLVGPVGLVKKSVARTQTNKQTNIFFIVIFGVCGVGLVDI